MERTSSSSLLCAFLYVLYVKRILQHTVLLCIVSIDSIFSLALSMVNRILKTIRSSFTSRPRIFIIYCRGVIKIGYGITIGLKRLFLVESGLMLSNLFELCRCYNALRVSFRLT